jgi:hypothetical protein
MLVSIPLRVLLAAHIASDRNSKQLLHLSVTIDSSITPTWECNPISNTTSVLQIRRAYITPQLGHGNTYIVKFHLVYLDGLYAYII